MTVPILEQLRVQVENGSVTDALETTDELRAAFRDDQANTEQVDTLATAVRYRSETGSASAEAANDHLKAATKLEEKRAELLEALLNYATGEGSANAVLQQIDPTIDAYQKLEETTEVLQDHATDVPLGVILGLGNLGDYRVPKGSTQTLSTTVTNLGDRETGSLEISSTTDDFVSTEVDPESIANLSSNDETSISLTLAGKSANRGRGRLVVEGERRESVEFRIEVIDKVGFLSEALSITERLLDDVENRSGGRGGRSSDIPNRLSEIERRLSRIVDRVQQSNGKGNSKSVDNKIESVINQFEALIQKLTKSNGTDFSERARAEYVQLCNDAVNSLEQAIKAEP